MKGSQIVEMEWHAAGQPRPYADSVYDATFTFTSTLDTISPPRWHPPKLVVERIAKAFMNRGDFKMPGEDRAWHETYVSRFEQLADNQWRVTVVQPYCD